jgi:putative hydrolase of the HAD superfamily
MPLSPVLNGIRALAFDAVGTLIVPEPPVTGVYPAVGWRHGSRRTPMEILFNFHLAFRREDEWDQQHGWQTTESRERERWRRIVAAAFDDIDSARCFEELFEHFAQPTAWRCRPEVGPVLTALAGRGLRLALASNNDQRLRRIVAGLPELQPLDRLVISSEVGWRKPAPEFYAALVRTLACPPEEVLFIGDNRVNDFEGPRAAGLRAVLAEPNDPCGGSGQAPLRFPGLDDLLAGGHNRARLPS